MSHSKTNTSTSEFRESSVKLALETDQPVAHAARNLGINVNTLHPWISKYGAPSEQPNSLKDHHFDEIKRLKKELAQVSQARSLPLGYNQERIHSANNYLSPVEYENLTKAV